MDTQTVTKTVILPLQTSCRKNARVRGVIGEWQQIAARMSDLMPSVGPQHWRTQDSTLYRVVQNEFPNHSLRSHDAYQAAYKVGEAWRSWRSNGHRKDRPQFGDGDYARFCHCGVAVEPNERGYGLKVSLEPYKPEWFHVFGGEYQREYLERIVDGDLKTGSGELHLSDGNLACHLSVTEQVGVLEWGEVQTAVGVDLGERIIYAAAVMNGDGVEDVQLERGAEFRHHRERMKDRKGRLQESSRLREAIRAQYHRYTDHVTHVAARDVVKLAEKQPKPGIMIEDLSHYRERKTDAIHDWPFAELQKKLMYKATEAGIPVKKVKPEYTSITCRQCGTVDRLSRVGDRFECVGCGYEVHADVNAAINIAQGASA